MHCCKKHHLMISLLVVSWLVVARRDETERASGRLSSGCTASISESRFALAWLDVSLCGVGGLPSVGALPWPATEAALPHEPRPVASGLRHPLHASRGHGRTTSGGGVRRKPVQSVEAPQEMTWGEGDVRRWRKAAEEGQYLGRAGLQSASVL